MLFWVTNIYRIFQQQPPNLFSQIKICKEEINHLHSDSRNQDPVALVQSQNHSKWYNIRRSWEQDYFCWSINTKMNACRCKLLSRVLFRQHYHHRWDSVYHHWGLLMRATFPSSSSSYYYYAVATYLIIFFFSFVNESWFPLKPNVVMRFYEDNMDRTQQGPVIRPIWTL